METTHRKRCKHYDVEGDAHCFTFSCFRGLPLFSRERTCRWMLDALRLGPEKDQYDLWAHVIMPEHVHVVMLPHGSARISGILTTVKQSASRRALNWVKRYSPDFLAHLEDRQPGGRRSYRFWQRGGGHDRNLRTLSDIYEKIDYVHNNPVRRGLCATPAEWPWSSCRAWEHGVEEPLPIDRKSLPALMPTDRRTYH